jgi:hypothetical protein
MNEVETQALVDLVSKCHKEAVEARKEQTQIESPFPGQGAGLIDSPWAIYDEFYRGKHWQRMGRQPTWKSSPKDNKCFQVVESMTTFITDNRAKAQFLPMETEDVELANKVQAAWNAWATKQSYDVKQTLGVKDSRKFGLGWLYLCYDPVAKEQKLKVLPPESVLVDPDTTVDTYLGGEEPAYLVYEYIAQVGDLKEQFPKADWDNFDVKWSPSASIGMFDRIRRFIGWGTSAVNNPASSTPVYELWIRDDTVEFREEDLGGDEVAVIAKKKYKGGRRIIVAGNLVLFDGENPYKHGQFPFTPIFAYPESGKMYCAGDVELILAPQVMLNRMQQLLYDSTVKRGGGIALVNRKYGMSADMITNAPMTVAEVTDVDRAMKFEQWPDVPRHVFNYIDTLYRVIDDTAGVHDISRGAYTPGNKTAQEIAALTESDKTRVRLAARILTWVNERIARQWLRNAAQWNEWEMFLRIAGDDGEEQTVTLNGDQLRKMDEGDLTEDMIDFDVLVSDSSTLPSYFQERRQMAMDLFQMQVIDDQALLETLEFPGWRAILSRKQALMEQQAQMQAATQGAPQEPAVQPGTPPEGMMPEMMPEEMMAAEDAMPTEGMTPEMLALMLAGGA